MGTGHFIVLEGGEGAGKTTMAAAVADWVRAEITPRVLCVREPGSTPLCERIRALLKDPGAAEAPCPACELLLLYAARCQLLETVIRPHLAQGYVVIGDRHDLSTAAYQGGGRQLSAALLERVRDAALGAFRPQLTLLLDLEPRCGLERARQRGGGDRFEAEELAFFERVRAAYLELAAHDPGIRIVDASAAPEAVRAAVIAAVREYFAQDAGAVPKPCA